MYQYPKLVEKSNQRETSYMEMVKKLDENFNNLFNIYINNQQQQTLLQNEKIETDYKDLYKLQNSEVMSFTNNIKLINYFFAFICLYVVYNSYKKREITKKEFVNILLIFTFYISTLENLSEDIPYYIMTMGNIKNAEPFLDFTTTRKTEQHFPVFQGNIKIDDITFKYKDKPIFENFSLDIKKGDRIGIIGETGRGKTTLMKLILNFYKPEKGNIYLDGMNVNEIDADDVRKNINYINQRTTLFNDTILNNMRYGNDSSDTDVIDFLKKYDLKYDLNTIVEKNGTNISLGMQKIIFLVRGLLKNCNVFILDEPFSSIDQNTRKNVLRMIDETTRGRTVIVITHDIDGLNTILDRIVSM